MEKSRISEILRGMKFSESIINASLEATKEFPGLQQALDWFAAIGFCLIVLLWAGFSNLASWTVLGQLLQFHIVPPMLLPSLPKLLLQRLLLPLTRQHC